MTARITISKLIEHRLVSWLTSHPQGHERGAFVLFRKFDRPVAGLENSARFVAVDVFELDEQWVEQSSSGHLKFSTRCLPPLYLRCEQEQLSLGFVHSHPKGALWFSGRDDQNEQAILRGYAGCNGPDVELVALIICDGQWRGRVRTAAASEIAAPVRHVCILTDRIEVHMDEVPAEADDALMRQEAAFGKPFNRKLQSLRAVFIGAGGTGSPLATLGARCGFGEEVIIDGDVLEKSNLNRVRGYRAKDAGQNKATVLAAYINGLGLACRAASIPKFLHLSEEAIDALSTADVIFGCTDDVAGRDLATQAGYYYCVPYIDVGLTGRISEDAAGLPILRDHRGRISTMLPEAGACLRCQGVVSEDKLKFERAMRERPELAGLDPEVLRREYYLIGGGEAAPGVGPFTSTVADLALASFMNLIRPYRDLATDFRQDNLWVDFVHLSFYSNEPKGDADCFCCGPNGLLNRSERGYRLAMPALGKTPAV